VAVPDLYKVLGPDGRSVNGLRVWNLPPEDGPGEWTPSSGPLGPDEEGLHLATRSNLIEWIGHGPTMYRAEIRGQPEIDDGGVYIAREARLLDRLQAWGHSSLEEFAGQCYDHVAHFIVDAPDSDQLVLAFEGKAWPIIVKQARIVSGDGYEEESSWQTDHLFSKFLGLE
jgi:hypothetical protein